MALYKTSARPSVLRRPPIGSPDLWLGIGPVQERPKLAAELGEEGVELLGAIERDQERVRLRVRDEHLVVEVDLRWRGCERRSS